MFNMFKAINPLHATAQIKSTCSKSAIETVEKGVSYGQN